MNRKLKALGLGLLALLAIGAYSNLGASATQGGHFASAAAHTHLEGLESNDHEVRMGGFFNAVVGCPGTTYGGTMEGTKVTKITVTPFYEECLWFGMKNPATIDMNGCTYLFTIGKFAGAHNTVHLECPPGKEINVTLFSSHQKHTEGTPDNCTIFIPPQTPENGVAYETTTELGKHALTLDITIQNITYTKDGPCRFVFPTGKGPHGHSTIGGVTVNHETKGLWIEGTVTVRGMDEDLEPVNITATGSED